MRRSFQPAHAEGRSARGWPGVILVGILAVGLPAVAVAQPLPDPDMIELLNPLLGPEYADWLVGPIAEIASEEERRRFQALTSDEAAQQFIAEFWAEPEHRAILDLYERRAEEADRRFSEGHRAGRRTDRGEIFILYGEPSEITVEEFRNVDDPDVILWRYDRKQSGPGLHGEKPSKAYRFTRVGDQIRRFQRGGPLDPAERRRRDPRNRRPPFG